jgi:hypothetical protein
MELLSSIYYILNMADVGTKSRVAKKIHTLVKGDKTASLDKEDIVGDLILREWTSGKGSGWTKGAHIRKEDRLNCQEKHGQDRCLTKLYDILKPKANIHRRRASCNFVYMSWHGMANLDRKRHAHSKIAPRRDSSFIIPNGVVVILINKAFHNAALIPEFEKHIPRVFSTGTFFSSPEDYDEFHSNSMAKNMKLFLPGDKCHSYYLLLQLSDPHYDIFDIDNPGAPWESVSVGTKGQRCSKFKKEVIGNVIEKWATARGVSEDEILEGGLADDQEDEYGEKISLNKVCNFFNKNEKDKLNIVVIFNCDPYLESLLPDPEDGDEESWGKGRENARKILKSKLKTDQNGIEQMIELNSYFDADPRKSLDKSKFPDLLLKEGAAFIDDAEFKKLDDKWHYNIDLEKLLAESSGSDHSGSMDSPLPTTAVAIPADEDDKAAQKRKRKTRRRTPKRKQKKQKKRKPKSHPNTRRRHKNTQKQQRKRKRRRKRDK